MSTRVEDEGEKDDRIQSLKMIISILPSQPIRYCYPTRCIEQSMSAKMLTTTRLMLLTLLLATLGSPSNGFVAPTLVAQRPSTAFLAADSTNTSKKQQPWVLQMADADNNDGEDATLASPAPAPPVPTPVPSSPRSEERVPNLGVAVVLAVVGVGKLGYDLVAQDTLITLGIDVVFAFVMVLGLVKTIERQS